MQNSYDAIAEQWHAYEREQTYVERVLGYVDRVLENMSPGARVLDLGCGTGDPVARYIVEKGFHVVGVDQSEKMLEIAKRVVPAAEFIQSDMVEMELTDKFAAAVAWDSVFHVGRKDHPIVFRKLADALETGGRLLLSIGGSGVDASMVDSTSAAGSEVEGFTSEMFGHTFFYSGYEPEITRKLLEAAGFEIEMWEVDDPSSRGHIAVIARKAAEAAPDNSFAPTAP
jgi:cyclopropane fatty-acyl-phospholipid synthase-like methyltransferase